MSILAPAAGMDPTGGTVTAFARQSGVIEIGLDIKPDSYPNKINLGSAGVIPVALLSSSSFDATVEIDPLTISLSGAAVKVVG